MDLDQTIVNEEKLELWCTRLPDCRLFLENFFCSCRPYPWEDNYDNYCRDIHIQKQIEPGWSSYERDLMRAFMEIASEPGKLN